VQAAADYTDNKIVVPYLVFIHGESDSAEGTTVEEYKSRMLRLFDDYNNDIKAITGQRDDIVFEVFMTSGGIFDTSKMRVAALLASEINRNIHVINANPNLPFVDGAHLTAKGYETLGAIIGMEIVKHWQAIIEEVNTVN